MAPNSSLCTKWLVTIRRSKWIENTSCYHFMLWLVPEVIPETILAKSWKQLRCSQITLNDISLNGCTFSFSKDDMKACNKWHFLTHFFINIELIHFTNILILCNFILLWVIPSLNVIFYQYKTIWGKDDRNVSKFSKNRVNSSLQNWDV